MKKLITGILAHVDAGKTTLTEGLLYTAGSLRKLGRVDNGDAFLDSDALEKKRGITIFSHQAQLQTDNLHLTILDTPGHIDFASQTQQVLTALDYAILVVSAADGITSYTKTLWRLLKNHNVPTFIFVNKMDTQGADKDKILKEIQKSLSQNAVDFTNKDDDFYENVATSDEEVLEKYLEQGDIDDEEIQKMIADRKVFPVYFGSALKLENIELFLKGLEKWTIQPSYGSEFGARVFKISHDEKGQRLTRLKIIGGELKAKSEVLPGQKVDQLRNYNGEKFEIKSVATAGVVIAATGLSSTYPGQGLGNQKDIIENSLRPVLTYKLNPLNNDIHVCLEKLRILEDEDPSLHVTWSEHLQEIHVQIMGQVQLEILEQIMQERFNLKVAFEEGSILYAETITDKIEAVGHFEPLRHYAEVHLLLEPAPAGSGIQFKNKCSLEVLTKNWQHQIMTALESKEHRGVLTASPITDMKITLIGGKGSNVHTVGGDFRQAAWRAVRQGLMELNLRSQTKLLEPWYDFRLEVGQDQVGRAMNDIQKMGGHFDAPQEEGEYVILTGSAPVAQMRDYAKEVRAYTHGQGNLECIVKGYFDCHNAQEVIAQKNYDPESDLENTPNSVFCSHGAGHTVVWQDVPQAAQFPYQYPI
ncbi:translation factor GTPase family protein [uncultured Lactobacillus sp.]|uniref:elongation factor G n=1 Tax=uncultured Lactobacillus sp. TaxID=153152 RepID=UPI00262E154A|nr:TetM/TetW/TetO/TetS family tetracycline resistance ribosomal protection protein [uncultured Lactobacillus sp.]